MAKCLSAFACLICCPLLVAQQASAPAPASTKTESGPVTAAPPQPERPPQPNTLMDGTPVKLRLTQTMSSATAKVGQEVPFEVVEDVTVDGVDVLPKGSTAIGTVTDCNPKKSMGRAGKLNISISYARLADQEKAALRAMQDNKGGGHIGAMTGAIVATSIVFFPAAPLFLFIHGKDITIPQGTEITAFVEGDMHLDMTRFDAAQPKQESAAPASQASLVIDSSPPGADIEVDGGFVGNTPSTVKVNPGSHEVRITKKGYTDWTRKLNVTGGDVHLNADLDAAAAPAPAATPASAPTPAPAAASQQQ
jgi:hypothetical protein